MQQIVPNLWFNKNAQEAVEFYLSVFKNGKIIETSYYPLEGLLDFQKEFAGQMLTIEFEMLGQRFVAINAGNEFKFSEAISFVVLCQDQSEIDYYWEKLSAVPEAEQCGWCKDKFGLSWQINPVNMGELMQKSKAFEIMLKQKKIIIADY